MSDTDWISAREIIERLAGKSDHPEAAVLRCVTHHNCQSRAKVLLLDGQAVASKALLFDPDDNDQALRCLRPRFWEKIVTEGIQDWKMGCFNFTEEAPPEYFGHGVQLNWQAAGVEFFWPDIQNLLELNNDHSVQGSPTIGALPPGASDNDRKYAGFAHKAAAIIRREGIKKRAKAFRRVVDEFHHEIENPPHPPSIVRAVRKAYDLMYDDRGKPIQNDPK